MALAVRDTELAMTLEKLQKQAGIQPSLVITDSQVFSSLSKILPEAIPLTSFSILMARYKGFLETAVRGIQAMETLQDGDQILAGVPFTNYGIAIAYLTGILNRSLKPVFSK